MVTMVYHGTVMVYHTKYYGKLWYPIQTMVQLQETMVNYSILWLHHSILWCFL